MNTKLIGFNCALETAPKALRYLAEHDRPSGGEQSYNSAHLHQIAQDLETSFEQIHQQHENEVETLQDVINKLQSKIIAMKLVMNAVY